MTKLQLIHYLQSLLDTCNSLYQLQEKLMEDEIIEKADIAQQAEKAVQPVANLCGVTPAELRAVFKDIADDELNDAYKSRYQLDLEAQDGPRETREF